MKKLIAGVVLGAAVLASAAALARSSGEQVDSARVEAQIDGRLREVLLKMRAHRGY